VLYQVEAINVNTGTMTTLNNEECAFGYRDSLFKTAQRGQWIILSVTVRLSRKRHQLKLDYGMIRQRLRESGIGEPTIRDVSNAVISIRKERLPDPADLPNAGSFFKNPLVTSDQYESLKIEFPGIPGFEQDDGQVKIPAAWLIEGCQWKGVRRGNVGVHQHHALVLVNYGNATGAQVTELANEIQDSVSQRFGIMLEFEVNLASKATIVRDA
jgi:UDP-N-acetylmuramate dehydrogenase